VKYIISPMERNTLSFCFGCGCNLPIGFCNCFGDFEMYSPVREPEQKDII